MGDVRIQRLEEEADEMVSFVQKKGNKQWIGLAMDAKTRQIIAFHVSDRSRKSAQEAMEQDTQGIPSASDV